jgi:hypothetical protein
MSRFRPQQRVTVTVDRLAQTLRAAGGNPRTDYTDETGTVLEVKRGYVHLDRVKVELDHHGITQWFHSDELEETP